MRIHENIFGAKLIFIVVRLSLSPLPLPCLFLNVSLLFYSVGKIIIEWP